MIKVLVTGARGLLGSSLVPHLQACGYNVLCHARKGDVDIQADLTDSDLVSTTLDKVVPEVIVNLAALTNVDECERNPQSAYMANVRIVENLVKWIQKNDNKCYLVQISSDQVYDGHGPHRESDITLTNYYGFSKYAGELAAATVPSTILRTNFFGPSLCSGRASLSDWIVNSLIQGDSITVFEDILFSPLTLQRLIELIELIIVKRLQGVFNLGSKDGMSKADFAFAIAKTLDLPTQTMGRGTSDKVKLSAYRPKDMCMDVAHFEKVFSVKLPTLIEEIQSLKGI